MTNKIDNSFGAGSSNFNNQSKTREKTPTSRNFGEFISVDDDEINAQTESAGEKEESSSNSFGSLFGNFRSSGNDSSESEDLDTDNNNSKRASNNFRPEQDDDKPGHKHTHKVKPKFAKEFDKFGEQEEKKEIKQNDPLPAFQVPMQVDRMPMMPQVAAVEKAAPVVPPQMMEQIVQDVRLGINAQGLAEFQFDLKSDVLEGLKLKISTKDGQVSATFIAENIHVKEAIDQGAQELIQALQDRGLEVANLQVNVGSDSSGGQGSNQSGGGQQDQQQQRQSYSSQGDGYGVDSAGDNGVSQPGTRSNTDYTI